METIMSFLHDLLYLYILVGGTGLFICTIGGGGISDGFTRHEIKSSEDEDEKKALRKKLKKDRWETLKDCGRWFIWPYYAILMIITKGKNDIFGNMWFRAAFS